MRKQLLWMLVVCFLLSSVHVQAASSLLSHGDRGDAVYQLQKQLNEQGFDSGMPDGIFGPLTHAAVVAFQRAHNLTPDGIVGPKTRGAMESADTQPTEASNQSSADSPPADDPPADNSSANSVNLQIQSTLRLWDRSDQVAILQRRLNELGFDSGTPDGIFGPITRAAVQRFQRAAGLTIDGIVGPKTIAALANDVADIMQNQPETGDPVQLALTYIGARYEFGASGPNAFDCSGFVSYIYNQFGIVLPRVAADQAMVGAHASIAQLIRGDLVFFTAPDSTRIGHVGMYIGDGQFIHASSGSALQVRIDDLHSDAYARRYVTARRVMS